MTGTLIQILRDPKNSSNFIEGVGHTETQQGIDRQR